MEDDSITPSIRDMLGKNLRRAENGDSFVKNIQNDATLGIRKSEKFMEEHTAASRTITKKLLKKIGKYSVVTNKLNQVKKKLKDTDLGIEMTKADEDHQKFKAKINGICKA